MTTFLVIGALGLLLLIIGLVLGDVLDGVFDALTGDVFSTAVLGGFVSAFGFGTAAVLSVGAPSLVGVLVGIGTGGLAAWFAIWLTRLLKEGGSDATLTPDDALGRSGRVIGQIPADGFGTVRIAIGGHTVTLNARSAEPIEPGTEVHVTEVLSPTAVQVAPVWNALPDPDVD